jgi:hypothetical protein
MYSCFKAGPSRSSRGTEPSKGERLTLTCSSELLEGTANLAIAVPLRMNAFNVGGSVKVPERPLFTRSRSVKLDAAERSGLSPLMEVPLPGFCVRQPR